MAGDESIKLKWRKSGFGWSATARGLLFWDKMSTFNTILDGMESSYHIVRFGICSLNIFHSVGIL